MQHGNRTEDGGEPAPSCRGPLLVPHPGTKAADGGSRQRERARTYSAVLFREEVGAVIQAFLRGWRGPARRGRR